MDNRMENGKSENKKDLLKSFGPDFLLYDGVRWFLTFLIYRFL